ncbi:hypothetical protein ACFYW8_40020 [Streptomyces sp. NPDC002742]|uniref:hypothetical protein n=1 Tax=unclassified Streptomyces TaxID=2593676 RepID=UPI0034331D33
MIDAFPHDAPHPTAVARSADPRAGWGGQRRRGERGSGERPQRFRGPVHGLSGHASAFQPPESVCEDLPCAYETGAARGT